MFSRMKRNSIAILALVVVMGLAGFTFQSSMSGGGQLGTIRACGSSAACAATAPAGVKIVYGSAALVTGTPSTVTITGLPFTSSSSYNCTATENGASLTTPLSISSYVSGASFTISGGATDTDVVNFVCVGT
jgi:hypothetical protein